jgi:hypothetical protein
MASWLVRWEYLRKPPRTDYPYPLAHVHLHAEFTDGGSADRLHIPTARVPLELVIWHLIAEWGVSPKGADWRAVIDDSLEGFRARRRAD